MKMSDRLKAAFGSVHASEEEKRKALYRVDMHRATAGRRRFSAFVQAACACTAAVLALVMFNIYRSETAYISLDVNPSISLAINDFGRVIEATGYSAESSSILESVNLSGMPYEKAVSSFLDAADMRPYLTEDRTLWIAVQAGNPLKEAEMERAVRLAAESALAGVEPSMDVSSSAVTEEVRLTAEDAGVSATRYVAIIELQEVNPSADLDSYKDASIHEIHEETASHALEHAAPAATEPPVTPDPVPTAEPPAGTAQPEAKVTPQAPTAVPTAAGHHGNTHHGNGHHG